MRTSTFPMTDSVLHRKSSRFSIMWLSLVLLLVSFFQYFDVHHWSQLSPWGPKIPMCSVRPHDLQMLWAQGLGPFFHGNFDHYLGNIISLLVLSILFIALFPNRWIHFWLLQHAFSVMLLWILGSPHTSHIGASLWVYAFAFFLITTGVIHRDKTTLSVMFMVFIWMGGFIWGLFPIDPKVSWEGHIAGSIVGIVLGVTLGPRWRKPIKVEREAIEDPYMQFNMDGPLGK